MCSKALKKVSKKVAGISLIGAILFSILLIGSSGIALGQEKVTLKLIGHRFPATEFYAENMAKRAPVNVKVESTLLPWDKAWETMNVNLASGSGAYDIIFTNRPAAMGFVAKGWLEPLDKYVEKYRKEFKLDDIWQIFWDGMKYNGKIYAFPGITNLLFLFYRKDLFAEKGLSVPETLEEYVDVVEKLTTGGMFGTTLDLKRGDNMGCTFHAFLTGCGGDWLKDSEPAFNGTEGVVAVQYIKRLMNYAPPGVISYTTDESVVAMQQGRVATMISYGTRALPMDDPQVSKVVGRVGFAVSPSLWKGGIPASMLTIDGWVVPKVTRHDKDLIIQTILRGTDEESMIEAAKYHFPPRASVARDESLRKKYYYWPVCVESIERGAKIRPGHPKFLEMLDYITLRIQQALMGQMGIKEALDKAADEVVKEILTE